MLCPMTVQHIRLPHLFLLCQWIIWIKISLKNLNVIRPFKFQRYVSIGFWGFFGLRPHWWRWGKCVPKLGGNRLGRLFPEARMLVGCVILSTVVLMGDVPRRGQARKNVFLLFTRHSASFLWSVRPGRPVPFCGWRYIHYMLFGIVDVSAQSSCGGRAQSHLVHLGLS